MNYTGIIITILLLYGIYKLNDFMKSKIENKLYFIPDTDEIEIEESVKNNNNILGIFIPFLNKGFLIDLKNKTKLKFEQNGIKNELILFNIGNTFLIIIDKDLEISFYKITKTKKIFNNNDNFIIIKSKTEKYNFLIDNNKNNWICNKNLSCIKLEYIYTIKPKYYNIYLNKDNYYIDLTRKKDEIFNLL